MGITVLSCDQMEEVSIKLNLRVIKKQPFAQLMTKNGIARNEEIEETRPKRKRSKKYTVIVLGDQMGNFIPIVREYR